MGKKREGEKLQDVITYLLAFHPDAGRVSPSLLLTMIFLSDWRSAIERGCQVTGIKWRFDDLPELVDEVAMCAPLKADRTSEESFLTFKQCNQEWGSSNYGRGWLPWSFWFFKKPETPTLSEGDKRILDFVIESTSGKSLDFFARLVNSTYPALTQPHRESLDLVRLAKRYKEDEELFTTSSDMALTGST